MEVSLDPPHLVDSRGKLTPAALIPFCAYDGDMNITGQYIPGLDFPVCNKFRPSILDGQLCNTLDLKDILKGKVVTRPGRGFGLTLAIEQKEIAAPKDEGLKTLTNSLQSGQMYARMNVPKLSSSIHLNNLVKYTDFRAGLYKMSVLKRMTGTQGFLNLADVTKGCQNEEQTNCEKIKYLEEVQRKCGCLPWPLGPAITSEVSLYFFFLLFFLCLG